MSESIAEMVVPGTYIEVRAEGLIGVGGIVTGNIGIVGTAARGPVGRVVTIGSYAEALEAFGLPDELGSPRKAAAPLSLTRTLQQAFEGGARVVHAVRIANGDPVADSVKVQAAGGGNGFTITARGAVDADGAPIAGSSGTWGHDLLVSVVADPVTAGSFRLSLTHRRRTQVVEGTSVKQIHDALTGSPWVDVSGLENGGAKPEPIPTPTALSGGADGADAGARDAADGLEALEQEQVNLLLVAGFGADQVGNAVQGHLQRTLSEGRERIAVLGARAPGSATDAAPVISDADGLENDRVVLVAPGIRTAEGTLPPSYLAAVVAGRLGTLAPHVSLTNKALPVTPDVRYSTGVVSTLLGKQVLVVRPKFGTQVVRGITTSAPPFAQISVRRTVDYAKAGVRLGSDPYIGRLNNARVRAALQSTLDGFLSQMVLDEMLTGYDLSVTATRAQEVAGVCQVVMNLKPTFSIDYIRVTMNLE